MSTTAWTATVKVTTTSRLVTPVTTSPSSSDVMQMIVPSIFEVFSSFGFQETRFHWLCSYFISPTFAVSFAGASHLSNFYQSSLGLLALAKLTAADLFKAHGLKISAVYWWRLPYSSIPNPCLEFLKNIKSLLTLSFWMIYEAFCV